MSLDIYLDNDGDGEVFSSNITHNLTKMADVAGIYQAVWRPEEIGIFNAAQLIEPLRAGLVKMVESPTEFKRHDAPNGWGVYGNLLLFLSEYLEACMKHPEATIRVSR